MHTLFETFVLEQKLDERYAQESPAIIKAVKLLYRTGIFDSSANFTDTVATDKNTAFAKDNYIIRKPNISPTELVSVFSISIRLNTNTRVDLEFGGTTYSSGVGGVDFADIVKQLKDVAKRADVGITIGTSPWTHSGTGKLRDAETMLLYIITTRAK